MEQYRYTDVVKRLFLTILRELPVTIDMNIGAVESDRYKYKINNKKIIFILYCFNSIRPSHFFTNKTLNLRF